MEIPDIKSRLTMSMVLHHYGLKPDKNARLHCPFHEDKTPSMQVYYKTHNYLHADRPELLAFAKEPGDALILGQYGEKINSHGISQMINEYRPADDKIQPLKIRQSVIANLLKRETDARIVQVFAGHRRVSTTGQYRKTDMETLQEAVNEYHPVK